MADTRRLPIPRVESWSWQRHAACRNLSDALFFSPDGERGQSRRDREAYAKALCAGCTVRTACREHALAAHEPYGIWGGLTEREREALLTRSEAA